MVGGLELLAVPRAPLAACIPCVPVEVYNCHFSITKLAVKKELCALKGACWNLLCWECFLLGMLSHADRAFSIYRFHVRWFSRWLWLRDIPGQLLHQNPDREQQLGIPGKTLLDLGILA